MSARRQWLVVGAVVAALGLGLWALTVRLGDELFPVRIGDAAPTFAATPVGAGADSTRLAALADYAGEVVLLNIWATWCGPCRVEMPSMQRLQEQLGPRGLRIVAVSVDDPGASGKIRAFADELGLTFTLLHDPSKAIERTYQTTGVPETFLIGRDGTIRRRSIGAEDWASAANVAQLERMLAEPRP